MSARRPEAIRSRGRQSAQTSPPKSQRRLTSAATGALRRPRPTTALHEEATPYRIRQDEQEAQDRQTVLNPVHPENPVSHPHSEFRGPRFIDLFCGCGGFTLGMLRAGFRCLAAIDFDPQAVATLRANLLDRTHPGFTPVAQVLERDLTEFGPEQLAALLQGSTARPISDHPRPIGWGEGRGEGANGTVDVIVGGPPCQGFSKVRRVDGTNNGPRLIHDPRRHLFRDFLRYVDFFQPRGFVMENVLGLRSASGGEYFTAVQKEARELGRAAGKPGYRVHGQIEDAWELGVPQKRRRQLIIGYAVVLNFVGQPSFNWTLLSKEQ